MLNRDDSLFLFFDIASRRGPFSLRERCGAWLRVKTLGILHRRDSHVFPEPRIKVKAVPESDLRRDVADAAPNAETDDVKRPADPDLQKNLVNGLSGVGLEIMAEL